MKTLGLVVRAARIWLALPIILVGIAVLVMGCIVAGRANTAAIRDSASKRLRAEPRS